MHLQPLLGKLVWPLPIAVVLIRPAPAFSSFNLDDVVTGRIWVPSLVVAPEGLVSTGRAVALSDFPEDCQEQGVTRERLLEPRDRDCRFERQLAEALAVSGMFRRVTRAPQRADVDLILSPRRSRVQFRRQVISGVKPLVVLTFFAYLWAPLPFEVDVESYDLNVAILDSTGQRLSEVEMAREFTHYLSSYSAERTAPESLLAQMEASARELGPIVVCRGPHAHLAVHELLQRLGAAAQDDPTRLNRIPDGPSGTDVETGGIVPLFWNEGGIYGRSNRGFMRCDPHGAGCELLYSPGKDRFVLTGTAFGTGQALLLVQDPRLNPFEVRAREIHQVDLTTGKGSVLLRLPDGVFINDIDWIADPGS